MPTAKKTAAKKAAPTKKGSATMAKEKTEAEKKAAQEKEAATQRARSAAGAELRRRHQEEFNEILVEKARAEGVEWKPRPSKKDKDRERLRALLEENPEFREELTSEE